MASSVLQIGAVRRDTTLEERLAQFGMVAVILITVVGFSPFDDRSAAAVAARNAGTAAGDALRQLGYLAAFGAVLFAAIRKRGLSGAVKAVPFSFALLLLWCLASSLWSAEPDVVARRAMLAIVFVSSLMLAVETLGAENTLRTWYALVAGIIVADLVSGLLIPNAVHQANDFEAGLAGNWRGIHSHKNSAGAFAATGALLALYFAQQRRRLTDVALCLGAVVFLVLTHSKSSLGILPLAVAAGLAYRAARRNPLNAAIALCAAALILLSVTVVFAIEWQALAQLLEDPTQLTGRSAIWQAEFAYFRDHPLLGAGFGTFGNTGVRSPLFYYVGANWLSQIGGGHNGYLEILVTLGGVGLVLGLVAVLVVPLMLAARPVAPAALDRHALLFALLTFVLLHNLMESDFIQPSSQWAQLLLVVAMLRVSWREQVAGPRAYA